MKAEEIAVGKTYLGGVQVPHQRKVLRVRNGLVISSDRREGFHPMLSSRLIEFAKWAKEEVS